jgi:hypothetical protein
LKQLWTSVYRNDIPDFENSLVNKQCALCLISITSLFLLSFCPRLYIVFSPATTVFNTRTQMHTAACKLMCNEAQASLFISKFRLQKFSRRKKSFNFVFFKLVTWSGQNFITSKLCWLQTLQRKKERKKERNNKLKAFKILKRFHNSNEVPLSYRKNFLVFF